jgi:hypothetical protein
MFGFFKKVGLEIARCKKTGKELPQQMDGDEQGSKRNTAVGIHYYRFLLTRRLLRS